MNKRINLEEEIFSHKYRFPEFPANLKKLMKDTSTRVIDFAERYGVTTETVRNWRSGRSFPRKHTITAIVGDYNIPLEKLVGEPVCVEYKNVYSMNFRRG